MVLGEGGHSGAFTGPGVQNNMPLPTKENIALVSKEYALNTML